MSISLQEQNTHFPEEPKADLQFDSREAFALAKSGSVSEAHCGVGQVAVHAAVQRSQRVVVPVIHRHLEDGPARFDGSQAKSEQTTNRRRWLFTLHLFLGEFTD